MTPQIKPAKHIVIVAGEESGDKHASELVSRVLQHYVVRFSAMGGKHLQSAGAELILDTSHFASTGLGLIRHLSKIRQAFKTIHAHLLLTKPDLLILVDYPEFNLRLAKFAKRHNIRVLYYISPQIWAWRASRIKTIKQYVDHMAVILPFEKDLYKNAGVPVSFVGHPLVSHTLATVDPNTLRCSFNLPVDKRLIALLPGSRSNEIFHHMPVLVETARRLCILHHDLHFVIPVAGNLKEESIASYFNDSNIPITLIKGKAVQVASCSDCVIVSSGTASLECALLEKPMCIIYKSNALAYFIACLVIKVQFFGLCNLLANRMIVPELLQYDCNAEELTKLVNNVLFNPNASQSIKNRLHQLNQSLSINKADTSIESLVAQESGLSALQVESQLQ